MMPVKFDWDFELDWHILEDEWSPSPSEDIWKKFECLAPEFSSRDDLWADIETEVGSTTWTSTKREIRHHDCMWAGHCLSKEHRASRTTTDISVIGRGTIYNTNGNGNAGNNNGNSEKECAKSTNASGAQPIKRTGVIVQRTVGRSLLLNRSNQQQQQQPQPQQQQPQPQQQKQEAPPERPETPQSLSESEDEASAKQEDDTYWESARGVAASEVTGQVRRGHHQPSSPPVQTAAPSATAPSNAPAPANPTAPALQLNTPTPNKNRNPVQFDHNYDAKTNVRVDDLGVQTPSDSEEEEIDVVSVRGVGNALPTNPGRGTRQELEGGSAVSSTGKLLTAASEAVSRRLRGGARNKRKEEEEEERDEEYVPRKRARKHHHYHHHFHQQANLRSPRKPNRFSTDSETDTTEKRSLHNNMERMRRIDLRNLFEDLRKLVPSLEDSSRAAKVTILKEAANYCYELSGQGKSLHSQVSALRKEQEKLRSNLSRLRRHLAARR